MTWRAARSVTTLHRQLQRGASRAKPPATSPAEWGTIGDVQHDTTSDHAAKDFPGWGNDIVTAGDFPNRPDLGLDAHQVLDDIRRSRDPRAKYGISNGQIFSNHDVTQDGKLYPAWTWRPYHGSDGHYTHGHLSVVGDARADGEQPWATIGGSVEQADKVQGSKSRGNTVGDVLADMTNLRDWWYAPPGTPGGNPPPAGSRAELVVKAVQQLLDPPAPVPVTLTADDRAAIARDVAEQLGGLVFRPESG